MVEGGEVSSARVEGGVIREFVRCIGGRKETQEAVHRKHTDQPTGL
jgi:hypothetical protein